MRYSIFYVQMPLIGIGICEDPSAMTQSWMRNLCTYLTDYLESQSTFAITTTKQRLAKLTPIIFCK